MQGKVLLATEPELAHEQTPSSGERSFGLVFSAAFVVVGLWPLLHGHSIRYWALLIACIFLLLAGLAPRTLRPLNLLWGKFGNLLHRVVSPIVMGVVFFLVVTPIATIMRVLGKDPLRLGWDKEALNYWIERQPAGPDPQTMTRQF